MPGNEEAALVRQIVQAYRASGIPAKSYRGKLFVCREAGWEGPLVTQEVLETYRREIDAIERSVRAAAAECFKQTMSADPLRGLFEDEEQKGKDLWLDVRLSPALLMEIGFDEHKGRLYDTVARQLSYRGDLWSQRGRPEV